MKLRGMSGPVPVVHIGEDSAEQVAFKLMEKVATMEQRSIHYHDDLKPVGPLRIAIGFSTLTRNV